MASDNKQSEADVVLPTPPASPREESKHKSSALHESYSRHGDFSYYYAHCKPRADPIAPNAKVIVRKGPGVCAGGLPERIDDLSQTGGGSPFEEKREEVDPAVLFPGSPSLQQPPPPAHPTVIDPATGSPSALTTTTRDSDGSNVGADITPLRSYTWFDDNRFVKIYLFRSSLPWELNRIIKSDIKVSFTAHSVSVIITVPEGDEDSDDLDASPSRSLTKRYGIKISNLSRPIIPAKSKWSLSDSRLSLSLLKEDEDERWSDLVALGTVPQ